MRESDNINEECLAILDVLKNCLAEHGWKGRYLGYCTEYSKQLNLCKMKEYEARKQENRKSPPVRISKKFLTDTKN